MFITTFCVRKTLGIAVLPTGSLTSRSTDDGILRVPTITPTRNWRTMANVTGLIKEKHYQVSTSFPSHESPQLTDPLVKSE